MAAFRRFLALGAAGAGLLLGACAFDPETGITVGGGGDPTPPGGAATDAAPAGPDAEDVAYTDAGVSPPDAIVPTPPPPPSPPGDEEDDKERRRHRGPRDDD